MALRILKLKFIIGVGQVLGVQWMMDLKLSFFGTVSVLHRHCCNMYLCSRVFDAVDLGKLARLSRHWRRLKLLQLLCLPSRYRARGDLRQKPGGKGRAAFRGKEEED